MPSRNDPESKPSRNGTTTAAPARRLRKRGCSAPPPAASRVVPVPHAPHTSKTITGTVPASGEVTAPVALREKQVALMQQKLKTLAASRKLQQHCEPLGTGGSDSGESIVTNRAGLGSRASTASYHHMIAQPRLSLEDHEAEIRVSLQRLENPWLAREVERNDGRLKRRERAFSRCQRLLTPSAAGLVDGATLFAPTPLLVQQLDHRGNLDLALNPPLCERRSATEGPAVGAMLLGQTTTEQQLASRLWERAAHELGEVESLWRSRGGHEHFSILDAALAAGHEQSIRRRAARLKFDVTSSGHDVVEWGWPAAAAAPSPVLAASTPADSSSTASRIFATPRGESRQQFFGAELQECVEPVEPLLLNADGGRGVADDHGPQSVPAALIKAPDTRPINLNRRQPAPAARSAASRPSTYAEKFARAHPSAATEPQLAARPQQDVSSLPSSHTEAVDAAVCFHSSSRRVLNAAHQENDASHFPHVPPDDHHQGPSKWLDDYVSMRLKHLNQQQNFTSRSATFLRGPSAPQR